LGLKAAVRGTSAIFFGTVLLSGTLARAGVNVPDWVRQAAAQPLGAYPPETKAVVLLDQTDYVVTGSGQFNEHRRMVTKIIRPEGREVANPILFHAKTEKVTSLHAWVMDGAGHDFELRDKDFFEAGLFDDFVLYSDEVAHTGKAPAANPGAVVGFEYEVRRREWVNELPWMFEQEIPVVRAILTVQLPTGWEYQASWVHTDAVKPIQLAENRWQWNLGNISGIDEKEAFMPSFQSLAKRMSVSYYATDRQNQETGTWREVGLWYASLADGRSESTPEISAKVSQLIAGKLDFASRVTAITSFLQSDIRYVAVSIGIGGAQPHPAKDVFHYRYGDCKDKVTLLRAMLHDAGINSHYVLIDSHRGFVDPRAPSSFGDHVIIAIELPKDVNAGYWSVIKTKDGPGYLIFDPTSQYIPAGSLSPELQDSYAVLVSESGGELIRTPVAPPDSNEINRVGHFVLDAEGGLKGEGTETWSGIFAADERHHLRNWDEKQRTDFLERYLNRDISGFIIDNVDVQSPERLDADVEFKYKFSIPQYGKQRGPLMLVRPRVLGEKGWSAQHKSREYPIDLRRTATQIDTFDIEIPKGYAVDDIPDPAKIDVGFASYQSKFQVEGTKLHYWREYIVRDLSVPPEKFEDWVRLQGVIGADEAAAAVLKRTP
jgi:transglutaminase-like putative cysteine protease